MLILYNINKKNIDKITRSLQIWKPLLPILKTEKSDLISSKKHCFSSECELLAKVK